MFYFVTFCLVFSWYISLWDLPSLMHVTIFDDFYIQINILLYKHTTMYAFTCIMLGNNTSSSVKRSEFPRMSSSRQHQVGNTLSWYTFHWFSFNMLISEYKQLWKKLDSIHYSVQVLADWIFLSPSPSLSFSFSFFFFFFSFSPLFLPELLLSPGPCTKWPLLVDVNTRGHLINVWSTANSILFDSGNRCLLLISRVNLYAIWKGSRYFKWNYHFISLQLHQPYSDWLCSMCYIFLT